MDINLNIENEAVDFSLLPKNSSLCIKREDKIHPHISGNKYRKLKYNLEAAKQKGFDTLLTFGGAYSNHITATATAGAEYGFKTIGIIRGDELANKIDQNPSLSFAQQLGMRFKFITREAYRKKKELTFIENLKNEFGDFYVIPEGGTNALAVKGCEEILTAQDSSFDFICTAIGTGGTIAGLINTIKPQQKVLGFPALKGDFLKADIAALNASTNSWELISDYHFGGFGKINTDLIAFINKFTSETGIPLDPIYTGKMIFGIVDLMQKGYFKKESKILAIHTGGLQGIQGMNIKLKQKGMPLLTELKD